MIKSSILRRTTYISVCVCVYLVHMQGYRKVDTAAPLVFLHQC